MFVLVCIDTATTQHHHVDEQLRRDLFDGSARLKILGVLGAYVADWWNSVLREDWQPVEYEGFDNVDEPEETPYLA